MAKKYLKNVLHVTWLQKVEKIKLDQFFTVYLEDNLAAISDYKYSKALVAHGKKWSYGEMNAYLLKPQAHIKGTKMAFAGLKSEKDRASVILYMNSFSDSPLPKP